MSHHIPGHPSLIPKNMPGAGGLTLANYLYPPGVSPERLEVLRRAFDATMKDPEFRAEAQRLGMEVNPVGGEDVQRLVTKIMGTPADLADRAREMLKPR
jgi:tripartite-type tricarboxylate transporter receptor subunit TctC